MLYEGYNKPFRCRGSSREGRTCYQNFAASTKKQEGMGENVSYRIQYCLTKQINVFNCSRTRRKNAWSNIVGYTGKNLLFFEFVFAFSPPQEEVVAQKQANSLRLSPFPANYCQNYPPRAHAFPPQKKYKSRPEKKTQKARQSIIRVIACSQLISDDERPAIKMFFLLCFFPRLFITPPGGRGETEPITENAKKRVTNCAAEKKHRLYGDI